MYLNSFDATSLILGVILLVCIFVITVWWYYGAILCKYKLPPGPWGLPVVGYLPFLGPQPQEKFLRLREKYGDVYSVQMGSFTAIVLNGRIAIKDVLLNSTGVFDSRPDFYSFRVYRDRFAFEDYSEKWIVWKKTVVDTFLTVTNNKTKPIDGLFEDEILTFMGDIMKYKGQPFDPNMDLYVTCGSIIYQILYGRCEDIRNDKDFKDMLTKQKAFIDSAAGGNPAEFMPWLSNLLYFLVKPVEDLSRCFEHVRQKNLSEHKRSFTESNIRDLTDAFLATECSQTPEMKHVGLNVEDLLLALEEIFSAGVGSMATEMYWILLFLVRFPSVQRQMHEEIEKVIGGRTPTVEDKKNMPFVEAVILESMRFKTPSPLAVPHCAVKHARIGDFVVPKGTPIIINLHSLTRDSEIWEHPNAFKPEHFLTPAGQLDRDKAAQMSPFGMGKRKCIGEVLTKNYLFIWLVSIAQKFQILSIEGEEYNIVGVNGITDCPKPYKIIAESRE